MALAVLADGNHALGICRAHNPAWRIVWQFREAERRLNAAWLAVTGEEVTHGEAICPSLHPVAAATASDAHRSLGRSDAETVIEVKRLTEAGAVRFRTGMQRNYDNRNSIATNHRSCASTSSTTLTAVPGDFDCILVTLVTSACIERPLKSTQIVAPILGVI